MLSSYFAAGALALAATVANAQSTAEPIQVALVEAQFNASGLNTPIDDSQSLNMPLQAVGLLNVTYGDMTIQNGQAYPADQVNARPSFTAIPLEGASINGSYTLMLADFSAIGNPDPEGEYRHYLANDVQISSVGMLSNGTVITYYAGPGPLVGTGIHRYAWLLFQQPEAFTAPANLSTSGVAPGHWSVESYVQSSGLGDLVMASFFTVENGAPSVSAVSTTAVNTATLFVPSSAGSAAASGSAASGSGSSAAAGASNSAGAGSNANSNGSGNTGAAASTYAVSSGIAMGAVAGVIALLA
ncbi:PEBP-like protein [Cystobasidium minutum MCA 4210]|uniref:PEBP-like protein n=1 Tax=Cystobasidium minutum MCA 4210 TaxID=1397322 RepID=UPI0034CF654E|eukprot:jgi/Rhomi1/93732/CE93731_2139